MTWVVFVAGAVLSWGVYGAMLHQGQQQLGNPLKALLCVGVAYFLVGVVIPVATLSSQGALGGWNSGLEASGVPTKATLIGKFVYVNDRLIEQKVAIVGPLDDVSSKWDAAGLDDDLTTWLWGGLAIQSVTATVDQIQCSWGQGLDTFGQLTGAMVELDGHLVRVDQPPIGEFEIRFTAKGIFCVTGV